MVARTVAVAALGLLLALSPGALGAQGGSPLDVEVRPEEGAAIVRVGDVLAESSLQEALHAGLPLRVEIRTQLWRDGFFDDLEGQTHWRASVVFDPLERRYVLTLPDRPVEDRSFPTLARLRSELPEALEPDLRPADAGRYYYLSRIEIETLSLSDLEELRRWLRGDLAEALAGEGDVSGALGRGLRRTVVRLLGMPARRFETRSETFEYAPAR